MTGRRATAMLAGLTVLVLALSLPGSLRDAFDRGGLYLFSHAFLEDIPDGSPARVDSASSSSP